MKALNPLMILYHSIGWPVLMRNMYTTTGGYKYAISFISSHMIMPHIFLHLDIEYLVNEYQVHHVLNVKTFIYKAVRWKRN